MPNSLSSRLSGSALVRTKFLLLLVGLYLSFLTFLSVNKSSVVLLDVLASTSEMQLQYQATLEYLVGQHQGQLNTNTTNSDDVLHLNHKENHTQSPPNNSQPTLTTPEKTPTTEANKSQPKEEQQKQPLAQKTNKGVLYSEARSDRMGAKVQDMLTAHAYAFEQNMTYGGACFVKRKSSWVKETEELIEQMGLQPLGLKFACPTNKADVITDERYRKKDTAIFTPEWRAHIRQLMGTKRPQKEMGNNNTLKVVVHIRRGDVRPCYGTKSRYLSNGHYKRLLQHHVMDKYGASGKKIVIIIHSESQSFEPWNSTDRWIDADHEFRFNDSAPQLPPDIMANNDDNNVTVQLRLDAPLVETWRDMATADVFGTSKSSFSIVPAILNFDGEIVYSRFWHGPLRHWKRVDGKVVGPTSDEVRHLYYQCMKPAKEAEERKKMMMLQNNQTEQSGESAAATDDNVKASENTTVNDTPSVPTVPQPVFYSEARPDRMGAKVQDMLMAHAYAFRNNMTYGGACFAKTRKSWIPETEELIDQMGLRPLGLGFACPANKSEVVNDERYRTMDTSIFTPAWRSHVREQLTKHGSVLLLKGTEEGADKSNLNNNDTIKVVVHIRRGDVIPCFGKIGRYLSNNHYKRLLKHYVMEKYGSSGKKIFIKIHSQSQSEFEPWNTTYRWIQEDHDLIFNETVPPQHNMTHNVTVQIRLDAPLVETWRDMATADVFGTSKSSFSIVPAVLNFDGEIVYTRFWHKPLKHWIQVDGRVAGPTYGEVKPLYYQCKKQSEEKAKARQEWFAAHAANKTKHKR